MTFSIRSHDSIASITQSDWNDCALPQTTPYKPFVDHRFLNALEASGSVTRETGWLPAHLELKRGTTTQGVVPMYLKSHSRGEYVFDYAWAEAFYRAGGNYYPKLQVCVPFTPVSGLRLLSRQSTTSDTMESHLLQAIVDQVMELGVSSAHITFVEKSQWSVARRSGFLPRVDIQFHWTNEEYRHFDDFLECLNRKKRKNVRRERRDFADQHLHVEWLSGSDILEHHWDAFYEFYLNTSVRKWGSPYLNRKFFSMVNDAMSERILLILCRRGSKYIAGALNFIGDETLYGRYWGCTEHYPFLHFELCYYQAMEYAIQHRLKVVEAGAQGGHKFSRGYQPKTTYSVHYIANAQFRRAIAQFLSDETQYINRDLEQLSIHAPFKRHRNLSPENSCSSPISRV